MCERTSRGNVPYLNTEWKSTGSMTTAVREADGLSSIVGDSLGGESRATPAAATICNGE